MRESTMVWPKVDSALRDAGWWVARVETRTGDGFPDVHWAVGVEDKGAAGWLELKWHHPPAPLAGLPGANLWTMPTLKENQALWAWRYRRNGGKAAILARTSTEWLFWTPRGHDISWVKTMLTSPLLVVNQRLPTEPNDPEHFSKWLRHHMLRC